MPEILYGKNYTASRKIKRVNSAAAVLSSRLQAVLFNQSGSSDLTSQASDVSLPPRRPLGYVYMALSATGVIFLPTTAKFALQGGSDVLSVAFARGVVATVILFVVGLILGLRLRIARRLLLPSLVVGIAGALFVYGIYRAILTINISLALLILFLYPLVIAVWEHFNGTIRLRPAQWIAGFFACAGLMLMLGVSFEQISFIGIAMAGLAMLASVVITLVNVRIVASTGSLVANLYMSFWTLLLFGFGLLAAGEFNPPQTTLGWSGMLGNGVAYCVSWVAFFAGAGILGATRASMITLFEPALAAFIAWLIFNETFTLPQWFGFTIVLVSLFLFEKLALENT